MVSSYEVRELLLLDPWLVTDSASDYRQLPAKCTLSEKRYSSSHSPLVVANPNQAEIEKVLLAGYEIKTSTLFQRGRMNRRSP
jgi:hypothetical protein